MIQITEEKDLIDKLLKLDSIDLETKGHEQLLEYKSDKKILYSFGFYQYLTESINAMKIDDDLGLSKLLGVAKLLIATKLIQKNEILEYIDTYKLQKLIQLSDDIKEDQAYTKEMFNQLLEKYNIEPRNLEGLINQAVQKIVLIQDIQRRNQYIAKISKIRSTVEQINQPAERLQTENDLERIYEQSRLTENQENTNKQKVQEVIDELLSQIDFSSVGLKDIYYQFFGSTLNGFGTTSSDIDLTLITNSFVDERNLLTFIHTELNKIIQRNNYRVYTIKRILNTRIPLLKIQIKDSKKNTFDVDLCINNVLGAINTKLMRAYAELHPLIAKCGILIKIWAKKVGLVSLSEFSSYAFTIMFIYYMQEVHKVPILQQYDEIQERDYQLRIKRILCDRDSNREPDEFNTNFYFIYRNTRYEQFQEDLKNRFQTLQIQSILKEFFRFYALGGQYHRDRIIKIVTLRNNERSKRSKMFDIFDPLDYPHNPGEKPFRNADRKEKEKWVCEKFEDALRKMENRRYRELFQQ